MTNGKRPGVGGARPLGRNTSNVVFLADRNRPRKPKRSKPPTPAQRKAAQLSQRRNALWALWRGLAYICYFGERSFRSFDQFVKLISNGIGADIFDPVQVSRRQLAEYLHLTWDERCAIENAESHYWYRKDRRQRFRGKELPYYIFRLRTVGCIDKTDEEISAAYRHDAAERAYLRKQDKKEEKRKMLMLTSEPDNRDVRAVTRARAEARDEAIIKRLRHGPMTYAGLAAALARDPSYATIKSPKLRRRAIRDRVEILQQRGRVEVQYIDGKYGRTALVSAKKQGEN